MSGLRLWTGETGPASILQSFGANQMKQSLIACVFAAFCLSPAVAQTPGPTPQGAFARTDYSREENWLCRPGVQSNACEIDLDTTVIQADGSSHVETFTSDPNAPIDCFYIYPTVSLDAATYSDLKAGPEELNVVKSQLARLGSVCRLFAPMYRQVSLGALRARMSGGPAVPVNGTPADPSNDVDDAWAWYLANENKGRGVVILGHSQGSGQITRLITSKIDGTPLQSQLISAVILGSTVQKPRTADVGGTFKSIPVCTRSDQFGCVISFSTFRETLPPSTNALFGRNGKETEAVCVNPGSIETGESMQPKIYFSNNGREWAKGVRVETPFVALPGLVSTSCVKSASHTYLEMRIRPLPNDQRLADPGTDVIAAGKPDPAWGLHLIDANIAIGDLVDVLKRQGQNWRQQRR